MAHYNIQCIDRLIKELSKLPGIGPKSAERMAFYLLETSAAEASMLSSAILAIKEKIRHCNRCYNISESEICNVCSDARRETAVICVVQEPKDAIAIEKTGHYKGLYHVLRGVLSPLDGIGPDHLRIKELTERVKTEKTREVIIATNFDAAGESTSIYLTKVLKPLNVKLTRLAHGIPVGSNIEYTDQVTLGKAIDGRREF
ncbi:MAG: recombination protein RecR [Candidatus Omnitrophica bacterium]|nr:recombination protein RecR [Candidatus Omnitrophota bacterium]